MYWNYSIFSEEFKGSDIMLEAVLEAEVAHNAKEFFSRPQNQTKQEQGWQFHEHHFVAS